MRTASVELMGEEGRAKSKESVDHNIAGDAARAGQE